MLLYREKEEDEALEQARQNKEQEHAKQMEKMKRERMREAERRKREAVSEKINKNFFFSKHTTFLPQTCQTFSTVTF